jgi:hypothetical protein
MEKHTEEISGEETPALSQEETDLLASQDAEEAAAAEAKEQAEKEEEKGAEEKPWFKKRFDALTKQREEERRRADRLEAMLEKTLSQQPAPKPTEPAAPVYQSSKPKPTLEGCEFDSERYADELTDWKLEQRDIQAATKRQQEEWTRQQQTKQKTVGEKVAAANNEGRTKFTDWDEVVLAPSQRFFTPALVEVLAETEAPADVAYYLAKNPEEGARIAGLSPVGMAMALTKIEAIATIPPKPKQTTKAPAPVSTVGKQAGANVSEPDAAKDPEAWIKWERVRCRKLGKLY